MDHFLPLPEAASLFPSHGWLASSTGLRHLRLPIMRLFQPGHPTYARFVDNNLAGVWLQSRSPTRTLRQLAVALRDLHGNLKELLPVVRADWHSREPSSERDEALTRLHEGSERIEISVVAAFVLLRRLADELMAASRPFLFEHWHSAPEKMRAAVAKAREGALARDRPLCDVDILADALMNNTGWFDQLCKSDEGIRDILMHKDHMLQVGPQGTRRPGDADIDWRICVHLVRSAKGTVRGIDLFPALIACVAGACQFMERLYRCASREVGYRRGDILFLTGADSDAVGFWPAIGGHRTEFPLT